MQLATTRTPHQQSDWNPFIEAADDIQRIQGTLREIDCGKVTTIRVEASGKSLTLAIPDLQHVQMRHAPPEFVTLGTVIISVLVLVKHRPNIARLVTGEEPHLNFSSKKND